MIKYIPAAASLLLLLAGCGRTPLREYHPAALPPHPAENTVTLNRSKQISAVLAPLKIRGVALFPAAIDERFSPQNVCTELKKCGFNRVYLHITSEQELNEKLIVLITEIVNSGMQAEIVISQQDFFRRYQVNRLLRLVVCQYPSLYDVAEQIAEFNAELPENVKLTGITVHLTPHLFNSKNSHRVYRCIYNWSDRSYGKGGDNDMLLRSAIAELTRIKTIRNLPPVTVAIPDFIHDRASEGELSAGTIADFCKITPDVAVINSANLPSQLPEKISSELKNAPKGSRILIILPLATHTSMDADRLRRRNWNDFIRALSACIEKVREYPEFNGVVVSPFSVIEYMRLEK